MDAEAENAGNPFESPAPIEETPPKQKLAASWWHYAGGVAVSGVLMGICTAAMAAVMLPLNEPAEIAMVIGGSIFATVAFIAIGLAMSGIWRAIRSLIGRKRPPSRLARSLAGFSLFFTTIAASVVASLIELNFQITPNIFFSLLTFQLAAALSVEIENLLAYVFKH